MSSNDVTGCMVSWRLKPCVFAYRYLLDINAEVVDTEGVSAILHDPQPTAAALVQELLGRCRVETIVE